MSLSGATEVTSVWFPVSCCEPRQFLIEYQDQATSEGYLRMVFDDLDLPIGTILQVIFSVRVSTSRPSATLFAVTPDPVLPSK